MFEKQLNSGGAAFSFTAEEKKQFRTKKYIKEHLFEYIFDFAVTAVFTCLLIYFIGGTKYGYGVLLSVAHSFGKSLNDIRVCRKKCPVRTLRRIAMNDFIIKQMKTENGITRKRNITDNTLLKEKVNELLNTKFEAECDKASVQKQVCHQ